MSDVTRAEIRLTQLDRYRFAVRMERPEWTLTVDEPPPVGEGAGPNPARLIATAIGHCLSSSLLYCLERARVQGVRLETSVDVEVRRNDRGRWRISGVRAKIDVQGLDPSQRAALAGRRAFGRRPPGGSSVTSPARDGGLPDVHRIVARLGRVEREVRSLQHRLLDQEDCVTVARRIAAAKTVLEGIRARVLVEHMRHRLREGAGARGGRGCFAGGGPGGSPERTELVRHREGGD